MMQRREFITLLGGAAAAWPLAARAQQGERVRRIGVLMNVAADDAEGQARIAAFLQVLQQSGWTDGGNVRIDYRWAAGDAGSFQRYAEELLALAPDVIWPRPPQAFKHCSERPAPCPLCSRRSATRSAWARSRAWRGRAGTRPVLCLWNSASARNGWSCSKRSRLA